MRRLDLQDKGKTGGPGLRGAQGYSTDAEPAGEHGVAEQRVTRTDLHI